MHIRIRMHIHVCTSAVCTYSMHVNILYAHCDQYVDIEDQVESKIRDQHLKLSTYVPLTHKYITYTNVLVCAYVHVI